MSSFGISLTGSEVKSLREGKANISESFASDNNGEIFLINSHIPLYKESSYNNHDPKRNRKLLLNKSQRAFYPLNERTSFKVNKFFRELTKNKKFQQPKLNVRGRELIINEFYEGIIKFDFKDLCKKNLGAEDFIAISNISKFVIITNIPNFNDTNADQQQRFITLIDILYEKKVYLLISMACSFDKLKSASGLIEPFKRTQSRLIELTSTKDKFSP